MWEAIGYMSAEWVLGWEASDNIRVGAYERDTRCEFLLCDENVSFETRRCCGLMPLVGNSWVNVCHVICPAVRVTVYFPWIGAVYQILIKTFDNEPLIQTPTHSNILFCIYSLIITSSLLAQPSSSWSHTWLQSSSQLRHQQQGPSPPWSSCGP